MLEDRFGIQEYLLSLCLVIILELNELELGGWVQTQPVFYIHLEIDIDIYKQPTRTEQCNIVSTNPGNQFHSPKCHASNTW